MKHLVITLGLLTLTACDWKENYPGMRSASPDELALPILDISHIVENVETVLGPFEMVLEAHVAPDVDTLSHLYGEGPKVLGYSFPEDGVLFLTEGDLCTSPVEYGNTRLSTIVHELMHIAGYSHPPKWGIGNWSEWDELHAMAYETVSHLCKSTQN